MLSLSFKSDLSSGLSLKSLASTSCLPLSLSLVRWKANSTLHRGWSITRDVLSRPSFNKADARSQSKVRSGKGRQGQVKKNKPPSWGSSPLRGITNPRENDEFWFTPIFNITYERFHCLAPQSIGKANWSLHCARMKIWLRKGEMTAPWGK